MTQHAIDCIMMRGGTSRGAYFNAANLPSDRETLADVLIAVMGAGHPLNINGIGGGNAVTTKVAILSPSARDDADIDYLFAQVAVDKKQVDFAPTCGNILSGVGAAALEMGLTKASGDKTPVRIFSVNTGALIEAIIDTPNDISGGIVNYDGDVTISGVPDAAAAVILNFMDVVGSKTGAFFPTGVPRQVIDGYDVTCIDVAMPMVLGRAEDFGISGYESRPQIDENKELFDRIESVRIKAGELMGLGCVRQSVVPKFGLLSKPVKGGSISGRYFMPWKSHPSFAVTGSVCVGSCLLAKGTVADGLAVIDTSTPVKITIEHPSGSIDVVIDYELNEGAVVIKKAGLLRTARKLFSGQVYIPQRVWVK